MDQSPPLKTNIDVFGNEFDDTLEYVNILYTQSLYIMRTHGVIRQVSPVIFPTIGLSPIVPQVDPEALAVTSRAIPECYFAGGVGEGDVVAAVLLDKSLLHVRVIGSYIMHNGQFRTIYEGLVQGIVREFSINVSRFESDLVFNKMNT